MSNEIKQGDKVRVSKDAPKMYVPVSFWTEGNSIVEEIHEGNAAICYESNYVDFRIVVPIKYLLVNVNGVWKKPKTKPKRTRKVDAEAKEAKYKVGQQVRVIRNDPFGNGKGKIAVVDEITKDGKYLLFGVDRSYKWSEFDLEPYAEPTEQTHQRATIISEGDIHSLDEKPTNKFGSITIPVEVDLTDSYWNTYAADLAKALALKVANKFNVPHEAAEYAVSVAKAVVEGLKRK